MQVLVVVLSLNTPCWLQGQLAGGLTPLRSAGSQALPQLEGPEAAAAASALDSCLAVCARHARDAPPEQAHASYFAVLQQFVQVTLVLLSVSSQSGQQEASASAQVCHLGT